MNYVAVEGTVTRDIWTYNGDTLFRLHHDRLFFTVRFRNLPLDIKAGRRVVVTGTLTSREQRISLEDFVSRATQGKDEKPDEKLVKELASRLEPVNRSYTEILATEIRNLT